MGDCHGTASLFVLDYICFLPSLKIIKYLLKKQYIYQYIGNIFSIPILCQECQLQRLQLLCKVCPKRNLTSCFRPFWAHNDLTMCGMYSQYKSNQNFQHHLHIQETSISVTLFYKRISISHHLRKMRCDHPNLTQQKDPDWFQYVFLFVHLSAHMEQIL